MAERIVKSGLKTIVAVVLAASFGSLLSAQCTTSVWNTTTKSATLNRFQKLVPATMRPRFAAKLTTTDWLIFYEDAGNDVGPHDRGFVIERNGRVLIDQTLISVPEWKKFSKEMGEEDLPAFGVSAVQVCHGASRTVVIGFGACCTTSSALLYFTAVPAKGSYRVTALPIVGGGKLELSQTSPTDLRLWNETGDGTCDGCPQHFTISEYRILNGKPVFLRRFTSSRRFENGQFDAHRIVLLTVSH